MSCAVAGAELFTACRRLRGEGFRVGVVPKCRRGGIERCAWSRGREERGVKEEEPQIPLSLELAALVARPTGLEPATFGSTVRHSNQLSYGPSLSWSGNVIATSQIVNKPVSILSDHFGNSIIPSIDILMSTWDTSRFAKVQT